jgi:hypothetical protein
MVGHTVHTVGHIVHTAGHTVHSHVAVDKRGVLWHHALLEEAVLVKKVSDHAGKDVILVLDRRRLEALQQRNNVTDRELLCVQLGKVPVGACCVVVVAAAAVVVVVVVCVRGEGGIDEQTYMWC